MRDEIERAEVLDGCLERINLGENPERVLEEHPDLADEIRPLLALARDLGSLPDPEPSVESLTATFTRLVLAETPQAPVRKRRAFSMRLWARAAAVLLVVLAGGWGAVTASAQAVPGDLLYPLKRFTERARFFLTVNGEGKAELRIEFSAARLRDVVSELQRGEDIDEDLLREMLEEARLAVDDFENLPVSSRNLLAMRAAHLNEYQRETLDRLQKSASASQRKVLIRYRDSCGRRGEWVREIIGDRVISPGEQWTPGEMKRWREKRPDCGGGCR